jgi:hypothetical protein
LEVRPLVVQLGIRLIRSPPLSLKEGLPIESDVSFEQVIDGAGQLLGQESQGFPLAVFFLQAGEVFLGCRMVSQEQDSGFRKGPFEMGIADFGP